VDSPILLVNKEKRDRYFVITFLVIAFSQAVLVWINRRTWFFGDDFAFLTYRYFSATDGEWIKAFFYPHNEHFVLFPAMLFSAMQYVFGLKNHLAFMLPVLFLHGLIQFLIALILKSRCKSNTTAFAAIAAIGFLSPGAENLFWAFQAGFIGSIAIGLLQLVLLDKHQSIGAREYLASFLGIVSIATQGTGITTTFFVLLFLLVRKQYVRSLIVTVPPACVFLTWFVMVGNRGQSDRPSMETNLDIPVYVFKGLTTSFDAILHVQGSTALVLVLCILGLSRMDSIESRLVLPLCLAIGAVFFYTLNGISRIQFGVDQATSSRYTYVGVVLLVPIVFILIESALQIHFFYRSLMRLVFCWVIFSGTVGFFKAQYIFASADQTRIQAIFRHRDQIESGLIPSENLPSPVFDPDLTNERIQLLIEKGLFDR
jgi:hypothetical protein